jgi:hypothetical protein
VAEAKPEAEEYVHEPEAEFSATGQQAMELVFSQLDSKQLLAMRTLDKYFRVHGSTALREHLKPQLPGKLEAMSSLDGKLVKQYHDAITDRGAKSLVVAADQVNQSPTRRPAAPSRTSRRRCTTRRSWASPTRTCRTSTSQTNPARSRSEASSWSPARRT